MPELTATICYTVKASQLSLIDTLLCDLPDDIREGNPSDSESIAVLRIMIKALYKENT